MGTTIVDIARHLGVAHSTVSRVLNNRGAEFISEATRERVRQAAKELGYQPNRLAKALVTGRSNMIALWLEAPHRPVYSQYSHFLQMAAEADGYKVVTNKFPVSADQLSVGDLRIWPEDGLVVIQDGEIVRFTDEERHPIVSIGGYDTRQVDCVYIDLEQAQRRAMEHFFSQGCRRIACMFKAGENIEEASRPRIYREFMLENGLEPEFIFTSGYSSPDAAACLPGYLRENGCPEAIFCFNDELAIATYAALYDQGYRIPEDVLIIGCDETEIGKYMRPTLTTISIHLKEACFTAWDFLKRRIENPEIPVQHAVISGGLQIKDSSKRR